MPCVGWADYLQSRHREVNAVFATLLVPLLLSARPATPPVRPSDDPPPRLAGDWKLDPALSESFQDKMRNRGGRFSGGPPGGGGFGGRRPGGLGGGISGRGGRGGRGGQGGYPEEGIEPSRGGRGMEILDAMRPPVQLSIQQSDSTVTMAVDLGAPRALHLDGRASIDTLGDMSVRKSSARLRKGKVEVERRVGEFSKLTEKYWFDGEHNFLVVDVTIEGPMGKVDVRRVYQPVKPGS